MSAMDPGTFGNVLEAAKEGEEWAFSSLYRDLNPRLVRYLTAHAASAGEDLASETWIAAAGRLHSFTGGETAFRGWMFTIARRRLIQHWRSTGRRPASTVDPVALADRPGPDDPEREVLAAGSAAAAATVIADLLSPDQADVVLLRVLGGLDVSQVAGILGKRPSTVRVLQHKALRRLAANLSVEALTQ